MPPSPYTHARLAAAVAESTSWAELMRRLDLRPSGGRRRSLQRAVADFGIDTGHFARSSPRLRYPDEAIAAAVASSTTLREVVDRLGARPATGTMSHIRRRIAAANIDAGHFPGLQRSPVELPFTRDELLAAVDGARSLRAAARRLGIADGDSASRAALRRLLTALEVDTRHFTHTRTSLPDEALREAVATATSYAEVMRTLGLRADSANHRHVRRRVAQLALDTSHFRRRSGLTVPSRPRPRIAEETLRRYPPGSPRVNRERLHRALGEIGVDCRCAGCGNSGEWRGASLTLQIDHINGDWLDNRPENLRYLCPNCHAITDTWCGRNRGKVPRAAV
ncbi:HNH endonuclease [Streptomyces palmae]|uniref:HNH endonuclease n=2 Tax=Streptomyces palmae TaxID=1701085 RepID=A0A4Z0H8L2_9ACTN|nr:HNH endonuclease [Streptomyces palmae]